MTRFRWLRSGRSARGAPIEKRAGGHSALPLVLLVLSGLAQTGCQADPCGPCARGWNGVAAWGRDMQDRMMRPFRRQPCCDGTPVIGGAMVGGGTVVDYGSGPVVTPAPGSSVVTPAPSTVPPSSLDSNPQSLDEVPRRKRRRVRPPAGTGRRARSRRRARPTTRRPCRSTSTAGRGRPRWREPMSPAWSPPRRAFVGPAPEASSNPLDNLPPIDLSSEVGGGLGEKPPTPTPVPARPETTAAPKANETDKDKDKAAPTPTEAAPAASASVSAPPAVVAGPRRFCVVAAKLAGGSLPDSDGLDWLVDKGYKTLIDLRGPAEVKPEFIATVTNKGLRYLPLPLDLKTVDQVHVSRFQDELARANARPIYFFDADGSRPGVLWYIRRITVDKVDAQIASREAEALGLAEQACWDAAQAYLDGLKAPKPAETAPAAEPPTPPAPKAADADPPAAAPDSEVPTAEPAQTTTAEPAQSSTDPSRTPRPGGPMLRSWSRGWGPAGLLDSVELADDPVTEAGQSTGTAARTEITSERVGCLNVNSRACSATRS